jgi:hypothetical protein
VRQEIPRQDLLHQHIRGLDETPMMATFLGPRCAIATLNLCCRIPCVRSEPVLQNDPIRATKSRPAKRRHLMARGLAPGRDDRAPALREKAALPAAEGMWKADQRGAGHAAFWAGSC